MSSAMLRASARLRRSHALAAEYPAGEQRAKALAVLGQVNSVGARCPGSARRARQRHGQVKRRLSTQLHDNAERLFALKDVHHMLKCQRLEVQAVGCIVVGRDCLRVAVDHDRLVARLTQRKRPDTQQ